MPRTATKTPAPVTIDFAALGLATLTVDGVARQTDDRSFSRGRGYARSHRIFRAVRRENTLRARCHGSSGGPYLVEATLAKASQPKARSPITFSCDCPRGGFCKHVVALLLTWLEDPDSFVVRPPLADMLANRSRDELVALIALMVRENPDFEDMLDLPVVTAGAMAGHAVDEAAIRRQINAALRDNNGYGHGGWDGGDYVATRIAGKLERLLEVARAYAEEEDWGDAARVTATFVEEFSPHYTPFYDQNGDLASLLVSADELLTDCLEAQAGLPDDKRLSGAERKRLIDAILVIWRTDVEAGGLDFSDQGPEEIARSATPEEQRYVADWLRQWMQKEGAGDARWSKQAAIGFLSILAGEAGLSDEELLTEYRNAELWEEATTMLLELGRIDEAASLAVRKLTTAMQLLPFADRLVATADPLRIEQAITLVDDRLWEQEGQNAREDEAYRQWLEYRYGLYGRPEKALELARGRFKQSPGKATYDAVKAAALLPSQSGDPWPALRKELLATLQKRKEWYALIDVYLEGGEIPSALEALDKAEKASKSGRGGWNYGWMISPRQYAVRIAAAAEASYPDDAIRLYRQFADDQIAGRNRPAYQQAASLLSKVWQLLDKTGRGEEWPSLISELRERNKNLPALRQELDALGLR